MLKRKAAQNSLFQYVNPDTLVPEKHILRRVRKSVDITFITEEVKDLYSPDWGRPSFDPEVIGRMFLLGYLYNLSDRRLCEDVSMHAGYRWFCGLDFNDPVPDQSTLVKLRKKWGQAGVFERIMDHIVVQCIEAGLVDGSRVGLDGTQVTANAATNSLAPIQPAISLHEYVNQREEADDQDRKDPPSPPAPPAPPRQAGDPNFHGQKFSNQTHRSKTDPDARLYRKGKNQEAKLRYLVHNAVDLRSGVVMATEASLANSWAERAVGLELLDRSQGLLKTRKKRAKKAVADAGYSAGSFLAEVLKRGMEPYVPLASLEPEPIPRWRRPTFNLAQARKRKQRVTEAIARNHVRLHGEKIRRRQQRDRTRVEHIFAEAKTYHGLGRARSRGLEKLQVQALLTAITQNVKRLAKWMSRPQKKATRVLLSPTNRTQAPAFTLQATFQPS